METTKEIDKELIRKVVKEELETFTIKQEKELRDFSLLERIVRVEDELKAQRDQNDIFEAQVLTNTKLSGNKIGLLLNFHNKRLIDGIKRFIF